MVNKIPSTAREEQRPNAIAIWKISNCAIAKHHQLSYFPHKELKDNNLYAQMNLGLYKHVRSIKRHYSKPHPAW
jgi:hypothetical protein